MGPALIPDKKIFRRGDDEDYFIFFSKDTVRKAAELFLSRGYQNNSTLEHEIDIQGVECSRKLDCRRRKQRQE